MFHPVKGIRLEFEDSPLHYSVRYEIPAGHKSLLKTEVKKLLKKRVVVPCEHEQGEFISPIFLRDKNDGSHRLILNLKGLNKYLEYKHFKMQTFQSVLSLIQPDCFMATIDLKDAYYSVKIDELDTKYLKFLLNSTLLKFVVLLNSLSHGPRKFTKLTKPPLALLRIPGHTVVIYIDDIISADDTFERCLLTVITTIKLFKSLGFVIHPEKSKTLYHPKKLKSWLCY